MRRTGLAALSAGFLASCATTNSEHSGPILYEARGDGWDLSITRDFVRLRERAGPLRFDYYGPVPPREDIPGGVRYRGELIHEYVVAGLVEQDTRRYAVTIVERPCIDRRGRVRPTTITFDFESEYRPTGCGGPVPRAAGGLPV